ncbi:NAD(P)-dependent oxidoreductase [Salipaludibacillus sp. LMS25]|jgi:putative NADH-flavin reductase|uniref:NAD(P)-dependent oxidoreductase n=1 Tax=Salipaludibacillus sp. LMS25 TaxID=2924031 RepID=UPI0020D1DA20|nr:NAD(P)-dependent oxidoreductase [Salipaludibacillus sp. LMS25]UTR13218.1 NAD(P)-dependent oxidoreductase [Salipaludibacillus sp. LMS25]
MKIAIIGASGKSGKLILKEALDRGHDVTALVRNPSKVTEANITVIEKDVFDITAEDIKAYDVVINAFNPPQGKEEQHIEAGRVLNKALKDAPKTRLIIVGGAGTLYVDQEKTTQLLDTPDFPEIARPTASNMRIAFNELLNETGFTWTFLSPAGFFDPNGKRTGSYKSGKDHVILNSKGESYISYADYAIAIVDEIENPKYMNERFTVVGESE